MNETTQELHLIKMSEVEVKEVEWLFYPYIPYGKLTILQGDPGEGKTTVILHIIAKLTNGESLERIVNRREDTGETSKNDSVKQNPVTVIYQTAEDGLADTIKPRLLSAGADCSRVLVIDESGKLLTMQDDRLELAIKATGARLVVLDPIQGYLGSGVDMHRANEIRPIMQHLSILAERYQCAIVLIGHMNKNSMTNKAAYRGLGSIDLAAAARSMLLCARLQSDPQVRVLCQTKNSLAPEAKSIAFYLSEENGLEWIGEYDISADDLLRDTSQYNKCDAAKKFLERLFQDCKQKNQGCHQGCQLPMSGILERALKENITKRTLMRAKAEMPIKSRKIGNQWYWCME
ncbi:MAG: AAA family ATPase [Lachnospiraceae bacterium]|nr:AAA family ATPase [Lachnospiraceae bacterium]